MADTFDDLAILAANSPSNGGTGCLVRLGAKWGYPAAPLDGTNIRVPRTNVDDARVQAAIAAGVWVAYRLDGQGKPDMVVLATSPAASTPALPLTARDTGSTRSIMPA